MIVYYPLSSFITLFANILHNPQDPHVTSDLQLMRFVTAFLAPMVTDTSPFTIAASISLLKELGNVATRLVEKTNSKSIKPTNLMSSDSEPSQRKEHLMGQNSETDHSFSALYAQSETQNLAVGISLTSPEHHFTISYLNRIASRYSMQQFYNTPLTSLRLLAPISQIPIFHRQLRPQIYRHLELKLSTALTIKHTSAISMRLTFLHHLTMVAVTRRS